MCLYRRVHLNFQRNGHHQNSYAQKRFFLLPILIVLFVATGSYGQILHIESFTVILDTSQTVSGNIIPNLEFQTQKKDFLEFENIADVSFRIKRTHAFTLANKIELSRFGDETLLSGGYLYFEYRKILQKKFAVEPFSQVHWADSRGMQWKYAGGINARFRILVREKIGAFAGLGPFYEFERWNYDGVPEGVTLPPDLSPVEQRNVKIGSYLSLKLTLFESMFIDFSGYHQSEFGEIFSYPRLASSTGLTWNFSEFLGISLIYQNIYDYKPVVPVKKDFHKVIFGISVNF